MLLASITGSITSFVGNHGVEAVFVLMAIDAVFPAASELVMVYAGAVASGAFASQHVVLFGNTIESNGWAYVTMALAGTLGYLVGSIVGWGIGRFGGRPFVERHGRLLHLGAGRLERAERWFDRHDRWAVLLGRITPIVRSFVSIPAGVFEMRFRPYLLWTIPGAAAWAFVFAAIGYAFGSNYEHFHHYFDIALVAGAVLIVLYLVFRLVTRRASRLKPRA
ncbi:MAG TPA: DedA family protein [Gaiellaceae bacterium]|nr:DedA family protein [Gaiellaceae bacterium]